MDLFYKFSITKDNLYSFVMEREKNTNAGKYILDLQTSYRTKEEIFDLHQRCRNLMDRRFQGTSSKDKSDFPKG